LACTPEGVRECGQSVAVLSEEFKVTGRARTPYGSILIVQTRFARWVRNDTAADL
jgi:hypothetical protein